MKPKKETRKDGLKALVKDPEIIGMVLLFATIAILIGLQFDSLVRGFRWDLAGFRGFAKESKLSLSCSACGQKTQYREIQSGIETMCPCGRSIGWICRNQDGALVPMTQMFEDFSPAVIRDPMVAWLHHGQHSAYDYVRMKSLLPEQTSWQMPSFTYRRGSGVCRDLALLLSDWLQANGQHAVVATGTVMFRRYPEYHAWTVIMDENGPDYILEATKGPEGLRVPPRAELLPQYRPDTWFSKTTVAKAKNTDHWITDYSAPKQWVFYKEFLLPSDSKKAE